MSACLISDQFDYFSDFIDRTGRSLLQKGGFILIPVKQDLPLSGIRRKKFYEFTNNSQPGGTYGDPLLLKYAIICFLFSHPYWE